MDVFVHAFIYTFNQYLLSSHNETDAVISGCKVVIETDPKPDLGARSLLYNNIY